MIRRVLLDKAWREFAFIKAVFVPVFLATLLGSYALGGAAGFFVTLSGGLIGYLIGRQHGLLVASEICAEDAR